MDDERAARNVTPNLYKTYDSRRGSVTCTPVVRIKPANDCSVPAPATVVDWMLESGLRCAI
ncbi:MAG: hypothetical protein WBC92_04650 [Terracidiphilus sp.]